MTNLILIILEQFLMYIPLMMGSYISFNLLAVPDFSIESAYLIGAICAIKILPLLITAPLVIQLIIACIIACITGSISGLFSGTLTKYLRLNHALSAIITLGLFQGASYFLLGGGHMSLNNYNNPLELLTIFTRSPELIALLFVIAIFILALRATIFTQLGYCLAAYGYNNRFFSNYGISSNFIFITGLMLSNACAGLSGFLVTQSNGYIDASMGFGLPLLCLSTLMLGSLLVPTHKVINLKLPLIGLLAYLFLQQMLLKAGFTSIYFSAAQALIILAGTILRSRVLYPLKIFKN